MRHLIHNGTKTIRTDPGGDGKHSDGADRGDDAQQPPQQSVICNWILPGQIQQNNPRRTASTLELVSHLKHSVQQRAYSSYLLNNGLDRGK